MIIEYKIFLTSFRCFAVDFCTLHISDYFFHCIFITSMQHKLALPAKQVVLPFLQFSFSVCSIVPAFLSLQTRVKLKVLPPPTHEEELVGLCWIFFFPKDKC